MRFNYCRNGEIPRMDGLNVANVATEEDEDEDEEQEQEQVPQTPRNALSWLGD